MFEGCADVLIPSADWLIASVTDSHISATLWLHSVAGRENHWEGDAIGVEVGLAGASFPAAFRWPALYDDSDDHHGGTHSWMEGWRYGCRSI